MTVRARAVIRGVVAQALRDDIIGLSAELAYRCFLALFPFVIFLAALGGAAAAAMGVADPAQAVLDRIGTALPPDAASLIAPELRRVVDERHPALLSVGALLAIVFATGATNALIKAFDRALEVPERRHFWQRYALALVVTLIAAAGVLLATGLLLASGVAAAVDAGPLPPIAGSLGTMVVLAITVLLLFHVLPGKRLPVRDLLPGAALFGVAWTVATWLFGWYVRDLGRYGTTFGTLAGVAVLLIWLYLSALLLLACAELNDVLIDTRPPAPAGAP